MCSFAFYWILCYYVDSGMSFMFSTIYMYIKCQAWKSDSSFWEQQMRKAVAYSLLQYLIPNGFSNGLSYWLHFPLVPDFSLGGVNCNIDLYPLIITLTHSPLRRHLRRCSIRNSRSVDCDLKETWSSVSIVTKIALLHRMQYNYKLCGRTIHVSSKLTYVSPVARFARKCGKVTMTWISSLVNSKKAFSTCVNKSCWHIRTCWLNLVLIQASF